jgi:Lrp/AsnC family transcriptional regulator for asnA, asnC and gidA
MGVNMIYAMRNGDTAAPLDDVDRALITQLQQDGRRPYREMARTLGVSEGMVRWRVRRLVDSGALRIAAIADPFRLGYKVQAFVLIRVAPSEHEKVVEGLIDWPEVVYVSSCTGRMDIYVQLICHDHEDLWRLVARDIPSIGGVLETETLMELKIHKFQYVYPPD